MMRLDENLFEALNEDTSARNKVGGKEIAKQQAIKEMANIDFEVGHTFDPDDFDYFKKVCKEDGWNVTEEDFQKYFEYLDEIRASQIADEDDDSDDDLGGWEEMYSKQVEDSDGFMTDYTWYVKDNANGSETHVMIFGDQDLYTPVNSEPDAEFDSEDAAREWFDNYKGFAEDLDEDYHKDSFGQSNWYENVDDVMHDYEKGWLTKARAIEICEEEGWEFYDDLDEAVLKESSEGYTITYYLNRAAAERRPATPEDVEDDFIERHTWCKNDFDAMVHAYALHKDRGNYYLYCDEVKQAYGRKFKSINALKNYFDTCDIGDGSPIICKVEQSGKVIYDSGLSKESLLRDIEDYNLDESTDNDDEIYNGYVVRKSDTSDNYFVYDNNGHIEDDEHKGQGYPTKEEAIERANSLEKGIAKSNSDLEEAIKPNIESEELKALAQKHNIKILDAMSNGDLRMEGAGADLMKFYQEAEQLGLWEVDRSLYEFKAIAAEAGLITAEDLERFRKEEVQPGESELEAIKRYQDEINALNISEAALQEAPKLEGAMKDFAFEVKEAGGEQSWVDLANKELAEMRDSLYYLKTYAPKEVGAGGNYDSAKELQDDITEIEAAIKKLEAKLSYINSKDSSN